MTDLQNWKNSSPRGSTPGFAPLFLWRTDRPSIPLSTPRNLNLCPADLSRDVFIAHVRSNTVKFQQIKTQRRNLLAQAGQTNCTLRETLPLFDLFSIHGISEIMRLGLFD